MKRTANLVVGAMNFFGEAYPRHFRVRHKALKRMKGEKRKEWDPFYKLDERFYTLTDSENAGYSYAADKHALQFVPQEPPAVRAGRSKRRSKPNHR